jgi:putative drug exporter of the RND superfamily
MNITKQRAPRPPGFMARAAALPSGRKTKWAVLAAWIAIVLVASPFAGRLSGLEENDPAAWLPADAESLAVSELQHAIHGEEPFPAVVAYFREAGLTESDLARIEADRRGLATLFERTPPGPVIEAPDGRLAMFSIPLPIGEDETIDAVHDIREFVADDGNGLDVYVTGPAGVITDLVSVFDGLDARLLIAAIIVVTVLLLLIYRSPWLWLVPIVAVAAAHQPALAAVYVAAEHFGVTVNGQNLGILPVLIFGVGTNYALLLISRYREALRVHEDRHEAMEVALRKAGPAILASGATSSLGLLCLMAADLASTRSLGPMAALGIGATLFGMITLLPALLVITGRRVFWPFVPKAGDAAATGDGLWASIGRMVRWRPRPVWIGAVAALAVLAVGMTGLDTTLSQEDQFRQEPEAITGQKLIGSSFPAGAGAPTTVIATVEQAGLVESIIEGTRGVASVEREAEGAGMVAYAVTLTAQPESSDALATVERLRERLRGLPAGEALVGGPDATALDVDNANSRDRQVVIPLVLGVILLILGLVLRSLVAPVVLTATVAISFAASLGASVLVFEHVFGFAGVDSSMLLLGFVFLVTLGIDYNIFMMTRTRQETLVHGPGEGPVRGLAATGGVISAAGIVLAATFAVVGILPLVAMAQLGFIVGFGVLLETFVVRSVVVPALTLDLGRWMWWPGAARPRTRTTRWRAPEGAAERA